MEQTHLYFRYSHNGELNQKLCNALARPVLESEELTLYLQILDHLIDGGEVLQKADPHSTSVRLGARPHRTNYVVKLKTATVLSGALILDAFLTSGFSAGALAASGMDLKVVTRLSTEDGSLCNFITLERAKSNALPMDLTELVSKTVDQTCRHGDLSCLHKDGAMCRLNEHAALKNLQSMEARGLIRLADRTVIAKTA